VGQLAAAAKEEEVVTTATAGTTASAADDDDAARNAGTMTSTSTSYFASATVASAATATAAPAAAFPERGVDVEGKTHPPPIFAWEAPCCICCGMGTFSALPSAAAGGLLVKNYADSVCARRSFLPSPRSGYISS
jgi:hypothetical protein